MKATTLKASTRSHPARRRVIRRALIILPVALLAAMLVPTEAHAAGFLGIFPDIPKMIMQWLLDMSASLLNGYNEMIKHLTDKTILTGSFDSLLGTNVYTLVKTIHQTAVVPVAESILALIMLVQLVKISQRIDATSTLPAVKDIVFLAVFYVLFHWFIVNSLDILSGIYSIVVNDIMPKIGGAATNSGFFDGVLTAPTGDGDIPDGVSVGGCFMVLLASLFSYLAGILAVIVATVVTYARAWQLYVMAAFSSIPVALLGFEETRQAGIGFLKNFASCALAGAIILFLLVAFPYIYTSFALASAPGSGDDLILALAGAASTGNIIGSAAGFTMLTLIELVALTILLIFALIKSGAWAKELMGN